ncbi:LamG domain-containing protein [archaeon]|nr:LamG domain-containing protein [Nanoarchaeota archaeon]MCG2724231.1 LamG domain-containing protein [archaeon]
MFAYFVSAATITVNQPPTITANRTPLLNVTFNETVNQTWFSIDNGTNTTACYNCTNFTTILNNEFPTNTTGLVGWWKFNRNSGENDTLAIDWSGNGNNGTINNTNPGIDNCTGNCSGWTTNGKFGNAIRFDGVNDYVQTPSFALSSTDNTTTFEFWSKGINQTGHQTFISHGEYIDGTIRIHRPSNGNNLAFEYSNGTTSYKVVSTTNYFQGFNSSWLFTTISVDYNNRIVTFYRNGVLFSNSSVSEPMIFPATNRVKYIGSHNPILYFFNGSIDEVRIYNRSLSATEVYNDYALSSGQHNITISANDSSGNINTTLKQFTIDSAAPVINFTNPTPNNEILNQNWAFINATSDETLIGVVLEWDGINETMQGSGINFYKNKTWLSGNYTFKVYGTDTLGNINVSETRWVYANSTISPVTISTSDGLNITVAPNGTLSGIKINDSELFSSGILNGFYLKDYATGSPFIQMKGEITNSTSNSVKTQTSYGDIQFNATYTAYSNYIQIDGDLKDESDTDRAIQIAFDLPINATGWNWWDYILQNRTINDATTYSYTFDYGVASPRTQSYYPFSTILNNTMGITISVPMDSPRVYRLSYNTSTGFRIEYDIGLSNQTNKIGASKANFTFIIYTLDEPEWGFRSTVKKYYELNPQYFIKRAVHEGLWMVLTSTVKDISNPDDFGFGYDEESGKNANDFNYDHGIYSLMYTEPWGLWLGNSSWTATKPSYDERISLLNNKTNDTATWKFGITYSYAANAAKNSLITNDTEKCPLDWINYFYNVWSGVYMQNFVINPDPELPILPNRYNLSMQEYQYGIYGGSIDNWTYEY